MTSMALGSDIVPEIATVGVKVAVGGGVGVSVGTATTPKLVVTTYPVTASTNVTS